MKNKDKNLYIQVWFDTIDSGFIGEIDSESFQTLIVLARYMNKDGICYPTEKTIAHCLKISLGGAKKRVKNLKNCRFKEQPIVSVERQQRRKNKKGREEWGSNIYKLTDITRNYISIFKPVIRDTKVDAEENSSDNSKNAVMRDTLTVYGQGSHKLTPSNNNIITKLQPTVADTNNINQIINIFYRKINPSINFANKTQRNAVKWLLDKMGYEKLAKLVEYAISVQGQKYAPTITTPYQLKEKLAALKIYVDGKQSKKPIKLD